jgi:membrane protease YdiL (CAAX protease family)
MFLLGPLTYFGVLDLSPQLVGVVAILGLLGPSVAGYIVTGATEGGAGVRRLLRRCVLWQVGIRWYLFALVVVPLVMVLGTLVHSGALASFDASALPFSLAYLGAFALILATGGPLFEEPGWRGTALPRLQRLHGPLVGGLILGALWALWHLPGFLIPSQNLSDIPPRGTVMDFVRFAIALIALAYIIQWVFNSTGGSVLLAILTHASWNTFYSASLIGIFPAPAVMGSYLNLLIGGWVLALVLIALTRGQLGYRGETDAPSAPRVG